ncbi:MULTISPECIES: hypothetical protein [unclassified Bosea (in: a-proteobacteria)]|nr:MULTISPECIES: hypothetical protein [unclassified Bosea (in: a-proteobacteria)]
MAATLLQAVVSASILTRFAKSIKRAFDMLDILSALCHIGFVAGRWCSKT